MSESKPSKVSWLPLAYVGEAVCELVVDARSTATELCAAIEEARVAAIQEAAPMSPTPVDPRIRRIDIYDGRSYTFLEVSRFYRMLGWSPHQIQHYWDFQMGRPQATR
eukprot:TRINITY_DN7990_c0_g1_i1.p3 TRINITY_DN7990_c0_g1~~TRINITY_DN7990_c0_g1_i1.p3  ORF type:complete len:108 (+),score=12.35 TRINITY_DN7990_c0_g1_i1:100-423(+)